MASSTHEVVIRTHSPLRNAVEQHRRSLMLALCAVVATCLVAALTAPHRDELYIRSYQVTYERLFGVNQAESLVCYTTVRPGDIVCLYN